MKSPLVVVIFLSLISICAAKEREMYTCKVLSQNISSQNTGAVAVPIGTMVVAAPVRRISNVVEIDTSVARLTLTESIKGNGTPIVLTVNGTAQFYRDGNFLVFSDSNGKKHKFSVIHAEKSGQ